MAVSEDFKKRLMQALEDEDVDLYVLTMHYRNDGDLNYFGEEERKQVRDILNILIHDTKKHAELLQTVLGLQRKRHGTKPL